MSYGAVRTASRRLHASHWRALSTSTDVPPSPHNTPLAARRDAREEQRDRSARKRPLHPRMIFVRPWDGIASMAHAFAIVRDVERRFGKIQEFVVQRDSDVQSSSLPFLHAMFARAGDADAIPPDGKIIQIVAPEIDAKREGGIGLDELHVYLNPEVREKALSDRTADSDAETEWRPSDQRKVMDVKLERTSLSYMPPVLDEPLGFRPKGPSHMYNRKRTRELGHAIHAFGGFVDQPSHHHDGATSMQTLLSRWSRTLEQFPELNRATPTPEGNAITEHIIEESEESQSSMAEETTWTPFEVNSASAAASEAPTWLSFEPQGPAPTSAPPPISSTSNRDGDHVNGDPERDPKLLEGGHERRSGGISSQEEKVD